MLKKTLRQKINAQRLALPTLTQEQLAKSMSEHLIHHPLFLNSQNLAAFSAHHNEMNPTLVLKQAEKLHKRCYLPALSPHEHHLLFIEINKNTHYKNNHYGIPEPIFNPALTQTILPQALDLVLMPLVAVDNKGNRLGMGGGFYDRTFHFKLDAKQRHQKPILLGLAYEFQRVSSFLNDHHDIPLDGIATEQGVILFE